MRIENERLLAEFRQSRECGWCRRLLRDAAHPHHVFAKGMGSGSRLDVDFNLLALGGPGDCNCHGILHAGGISREDALAMVAQRTGWRQGQIEAAIHRLRRAPKENSLCTLCGGIGLVIVNAPDLMSARALESGAREEEQTCGVCSGSGSLTQLGEPWAA